MGDMVPFRERVREIFSEKATSIRAEHAAAPWWRKWLYWRSLWDARHW
jgi:hypothetical protein